ncbi:hypothetical protein, partial [Niallia circulans]|uniref:hypothetical protein n=1 Tax=Niallia circulans TaxID=1397 RepID=UPI00352C069D
QKQETERKKETERSALCPKARDREKKGNGEERSVPKSRRQKGKGEQRGALNYQKQETKKKKDTDSRTFLE